MLVGLAIVVTLILIWYQWRKVPTPPVTNPLASTTSSPYTQSVTQPVSQPSYPVYTQPATQPATQPVVQPIAQPATQPIAQPATQPIAQPATQPITQPATQPIAQPSQPVYTQPVAQPSQPVIQEQPSQHIVTEPVPSFIESIWAPIVSFVSPVSSVAPVPDPVSLQPATQPSPVTQISDPTAIPTPAEIVAINSSPTSTPIIVTPVTQPVDQPVIQPVTQPISQPVAPAPVVVAPWCRGGVYCNGTAVTQANAGVGTSICGKYNVRHTCTAQASGDPKWVDSGIMCSSSLMASPYACTTPMKIITGNDGSVSGQTYCAGINGGAWNGNLPADWNGAKCVTAGFNTTGTPTGVSCSAIPGIKAGFKQLCQKTGTGWYGAPQVVRFNNGTVSGQTYCAGTGGAPWGGELPVSWNGAKCISAGFNATGNPTGTACNVIPGQKLGFRVLCGPTGTGWAK